MNRNGHPVALEPSRLGNQHRLLHGLFALRQQPLSEAAQALAESLMEAPHLHAADAVAVLELCSLLDLLAKIDASLADGVTENRRGQARTLIDQRVRVSGRVLRYLAALGLTPETRSQWAARLARPTLADELAALREVDP